MLVSAHILHNVNQYLGRRTSVKGNTEELCQRHAVCMLEVAKGARDATGDAAVLVLAGLFKTQAGTPIITPKALKVTTLKCCLAAPA